MDNSTFAKLLSKVDWNLQSRRPYVVADPFDPTQLLYMTDRDYQVLLRTALSNNESLIVVCRPGSVKPEVVAADAATTEGKTGNSKS